MSVREMVTPCFDGYTIYINARLSDLGQSEALNHAMWHISNNDFEKEDVQTIEHLAHRRLNETNSNLYAREQ